MKAAVARAYGGAEVMEIVELPQPVAGPGQLLVRVRASSMNPLDVKLRAGTYRRVMPLAFPAVLGFDFAGEAAGERVYGRVDAKTGGAHAQYVAVGAHVVDRIPASLSYEEAAALPLAAMTAIQAFEQVRLKAGERVLVIGAAGGVGSAAVQLARAMGAEVTGFMRSGGAALPPGPFDVVFDTVLEALPPGVGALLAPRGRYVSTGFSAGLLARSLLGRVGLGRQFGYVLSRADGGYMRTLSAHAAAGAVKPIIEATFPLERIREAHERLERGHLRGKIVVTVD